MQRIRRFEERAEELYLGGELPGFIHLSIGQEACAAGACAALGTDDYITSTHRGHGHCVAKGAPLDRMMAELYAKVTGSCKGKGGSMHIADFSVGMLGANGVVGGGANLAVGATIAARLRGSDQIALCFFGDGASNRGPVHEAMNLAAVWNLPVIFFCENNQWASTTSVKSVMKIEDVADRAAGYGMPGVVVDGNDVLAVYTAVSAWVERVRNGGGPVLIEAKTYRMRGHFVGDPQVYRDAAEVQAQRANDPIQRLEWRLLAEGRLDEAGLARLKDEVEAELAAAVQFGRESPLPEPEAALEDLYATPLPGGVRP
ncbi:MAG: thiamine pyrophosphate-dependent dehydrogenase E1 component subunit alpha [Chloroflexi bacterium]|nr:thiamine pyrophosphate-dependent dehydrogenase E1 component subunit alpha [Chloroflexota bacterium]